MPKVGDIVKGREIGYKGKHKFIWTRCPDCGKKRWVELAKTKAKHPRCKSCANKRENHPNWKNGRSTKEGYIQILMEPTSPYFKMSSSHGYLLEHRLVMAKYLGRCLEPYEMIHHKNRIRDDNRIENLELMTTVKHSGFGLQVIRLEREIKRLKKENEMLKKKGGGIDVRV